MSKPDSWMPLYIGDYLRDTSRLTTEQHGAYLLLIMDYWTNGTIPDDDQVLAQVTKLTEEAWTKNRPVIARFFLVSDGVWKHARIEEEREHAERVHASKKANGSKGGRPKNAKTTEQKPVGLDSLNPPGSPIETPPQPQPPISTHTHSARGENDTFPMSADWDPSSHFATLARTAGLPMPGSEAFQTTVAEFKAYWLTSDICRNQAEWDHKLVQSMRANKIHADASPVPLSSRRGRPAPDNIANRDYGDGIRGI